MIFKGIIPINNTQFLPIFSYTSLPRTHSLYKNTFFIQKMACSLPVSSKKIQAYVQKQCDEDDAARKEAIIGIIELFEQARDAKEDLRKQNEECKDNFCTMKAGKITRLRPH